MQVIRGIETEMEDLLESNYIASNSRIPTFCVIEAFVLYIHKHS